MACCRFDGFAGGSKADVRREEDIDGLPLWEREKGEKSINISHKQNRRKCVVRASPVWFMAAFKLPAQYTVMITVPVYVACVCAPNWCIWQMFGPATNVCNELTVLLSPLRHLPRARSHSSSDTKMTYENQLRHCGNMLGFLLHASYGRNCCSSGCTFFLIK